MKFTDKENKMLFREIKIDQENFIYTNSNIELKAGIYEEDIDVYVEKIRLLCITAIDSKYNSTYPKYYEIKFNCGWIEDEEKQDWLANVLASSLIETIIKSRDEQLFHIKGRLRELYGILEIDMKVDF